MTPTPQTFYYPLLNHMADEHGLMLVDSEIVEICRIADQLNGQTIARLQELSSLQLAGISTASIQNTDATVKDRITRENPYWTQAYGDVCRAVDREMQQRQECDRLGKITLIQQRQIEALVAARDEAQLIAKRLKTDGPEMSKESKPTKFTCFACGNGNTPLYCLNCANEILRAELDAANARIARGVQAAEGAKVIAEAWAPGDPCNNDNYCRLLDWIKESKDQL